MPTDPKLRFGLIALGGEHDVKMQVAEQSFAGRGHSQTEFGNEGEGEDEDGATKRAERSSTGNQPVVEIKHPGGMTGN